MPEAVHEAMRPPKTGRPRPGKLEIPPDTPSGRWAATSRGPSAPRPATCAHVVAIRRRLVRQQRLRRVSVGPAAPPWGALHRHRPGPPGLRQAGPDLRSASGQTLTGWGRRSRRRGAGRQGSRCTRWPDMMPLPECSIAAEADTSRRKIARRGRRVVAIASTAAHRIRGQASSQTRVRIPLILRKQPVRRLSTLGDWEAGRRPGPHDIWRHSEAFSASASPEARCRCAPNGNHLFAPTRVIPGCLRNACGGGPDGLDPRAEP